MRILQCTPVNRGRRNGRDRDEGKVEKRESEREGMREESTSIMQKAICRQNEIDFKSYLVRFEFQTESRSAGKFAIN